MCGKVNCAPCEGVVPLWKEALRPSRRGLHVEGTLGGLSMRNAAGRVRFEKACIDTHRHETDSFPRMTRRSVVMYLLPSRIQMWIQIAGKVVFDRSRQINGIFGPKYKAGLALDNIVFEGTHIGRDNGEAETVSQKQNATLVNVRVRENEDVCGLEIDLRLFIRD